MQGTTKRAEGTDGIDLSEFVPQSSATIDEERAHRKVALATAMRLFGKLGFGEGAAGHMTVRDPVETDWFWVNPYGMPFSMVRVSDLVLVDEEGAVREGDHQVNRAAIAIHAQVHRARPDVIAAAHTHSPYGRAFATLAKLLDPITQDACAFYEDHSLFDDYTGVVLSAIEGRRMAEALGPRKAVILRNHGLLTVGLSVEEAAWWYVCMERSCQVQLLAEAAGIPHLIDHQTARNTAIEVGIPIAAHVNYTPLRTLILAEQPDLLN